MKLKIIILLLSILFCFQNTSFCQTKALSIPFVAYWSKGDVYDFKVTKIKKQWSGDRISKNDSSQYIVRFEVIDSTESAYKIKWSYKNYMFNSSPMSESLREKLSPYEFTEIIYTTNELGEFIGIENWKEISNMVTDIFNHTIDDMGKESEEKKEALKKAMQPMLVAYGSKEGIEQIAFSELLYFHFPFGAELATAEVFEYEDQLPNIFGGSPMKADAKIYFENVDTDNLQCVFIHERKINPEDTKQVVINLFKKMGFKNKEIKKAVKTAKFDISDKNKYEYYYNPGVPVLIETYRNSVVNIGAENVRRIDKISIELIN